MSFDPIGRGFERSVPPLERRELGQHFTSQDVADILIAFCVRREGDVVLDPACGAGAFLLRTFEYKKRLNAQLSHVEIQGTLHGVEIADIPARLASERAGAIVHGDFLRDEVRAALPPLDAIVGNPPYTRQESIASERRHGRAGLHSYFLTASIPLLKEGGRLGFVMPQAWMQTQYGVLLQQTVRKQCKIVAIVSSKVERWFPDADVDTCLLILERCSDEIVREANLARLVELKVPLAEITSTPTQLRDAWLAHSSAFETAEYSLSPVRQPELFPGAFHGPATHSRATEIASTNAFPLLHQLAEVRFGVKTGANDFFYLTEDEIEHLALERVFFVPIAFSLKEIRGYDVDAASLRRRVLLCDDGFEELLGTRVLEYIKNAERDRIHMRPTCANRKPWYALARGWLPAPLLFPSKIGERMPIAFNEAGILEDKKFYGITPRNVEDTALIGALLNSTIARLFVESRSRQLTGSQAIADVDVVVAERIPLPAPSSISSLQRRHILTAMDGLRKTSCDSLFVEYGARDPRDVTLSSIKPELRRLDAIVMGELWGLSDAEQLAVYRALVDHVDSRLRKARSITPPPGARPKTPVTA